MTESFLVNHWILFQNIVAHMLTKFKSSDSGYCYKHKKTIAEKQTGYKSFKIITFVRGKHLYSTV